jgi:hypothetical protein
MVTLSNPRLKVTVEDYPLGGSKRGPCMFAVETGPRGVRVSRVTTGKPKYTTYGGPACICDGSDGRTYIVRQAGEPYGFIQVYSSDLMSAHAVNGGSAFPTTHPELYAELRALIEAAR